MGVVAPELASSQMSAPPRSSHAVPALSIFVALLFVIPSALRLPALGGIGYPAAIWGGILGLWWCWTRVRANGWTLQPSNPIELAAFLWAGAILASYAMAMRQPLPTVDISQADQGLLRLIVALSIVVVATDGIATWPHWLNLVRRLSLAGSAFAGLGLLQFVTGRAWISWVTLPGFVHTEAITGLGERGGFARPASTAMHPLEYSSALSVVFPIALTLALYDRGPGIRRWASPATIALAMLLSGSRSGYLGLAVGIAVLSLRWAPAVRAKMAVAGLALGALIFVAVPGMVGTIRGMFLFLGDDPSAQSRSGSYGIVLEFFQRAPVFGRGFGSFLPTYRILDNQILLLLVETGLLGLSAFLALVASATILPLRRGRALGAGLAAHMGCAICASILAGASMTLYFDAFSFPIAFGTLCLAIGLAGSYYRLSKTQGLVAP